MTEAKPRGKSEGKPEGRPEGRPLRVLLEEDSEDDALLVLRELRRGGYAPRSVRVDSPEALRGALAEGRRGAAGSEGFDVVISDYYMPRFSAPDALRLLGEEGCEAPVIVASGKVGEDAAVAAMRAGARDYVMKDNLRRLVPVVERELREARARAARREAEEARRRAEEEYRIIFERSVEGIFRTTIDGRILKANPALARMFGYEDAEQLMRETPGAVRTYADPGRREELGRLLREQDALAGFEYRAIRRDGSLFWASLNVRAIRDEAGELVGYEGAVQDITERKEAEGRLKGSLERLVALHEAGQILGATLEAEEIAARLLKSACRVFGLEAAVISLLPAQDPAANGNNNAIGTRTRVWRSVGLEGLGEEARRYPGARAALENAAHGGPPRPFRIPEAGLVGLCLPLRVRERTAGVLECYGSGDGPDSLADPETAATLESLANGAASALENARLYGELAERERRLQDLVGKILVAQEEERRRVAYEVHDGLAQAAAAAHQHLQAYARYHPPATQEGREDLERVGELVRRTVGEARKVIANLRPTALDDFGLCSAIRLHTDALRAEGWEIDYRESFADDSRLPAPAQTAVFRVMQEALSNVGKHAGPTRVDVRLERRNGGVRLRVRDYGRGFVPDEVGGVPGGPGERIGLDGMRERVSLLGGSFRILSRPGAGTLVVAEVPLSRPDGSG